MYNKYVNSYKILNFLFSKVNTLASLFPLLNILLSVCQTEADKSKKQMKMKHKHSDCKNFFEINKFTGSVWPLSLKVMN